MDTRGSGEVLANEPCNICRLTMVTSPASVTNGMASGRRSLPSLAATRARISMRPSVWLPGMIHNALAGVVR